MKLFVCLVAALVALVAASDDVVEIETGASFEDIESVLEHEEDEISGSSGDEMSGSSGDEISGSSGDEMSGSSGEGSDRMKRDAPKPNIIFILADDLGFNDIGYKNPEVITPNIDELANSGVILNSNYVPAVCTPSRSTLMTGRYMYNIKMGHGVLAEPMPHCVPTDVKFLPQYLKDAGYKTHMSGKWHMGFCQEACIPTSRGFDTYYGIYGGMGDYYTHTASGFYDFNNGTEPDRSADGTYTTTLLRDRAVDLILNHDQSDPMFMYLAFTSPHTPLQVPTAYYDMYSEVEDINRRAYLGLITVMDEAIGDVVKALHDSGMHENTLIVFSSDNGGENGVGSSNYPLRGSKGSLFEGGTRVVGFANSPLLVKSGYTHEGIIHNVDWTPTLVSIAGGELAEEMMGLDQSDMVMNGGDSLRTEFVYGLDMENGNIFGQSAIRSGDYKLMWGNTGYTDGWADNVTVFWRIPDNLAAAGITQIPQTFAEEQAAAGGAEGGAPRHKRSAYLTSQEENHARELILSLYNFDHSDIDTGLIKLFNIAEDPFEMNDLSRDPDHADTLVDLKEKLLDILTEEYAGPPAVANSMRFREAANPKYNGAWMTGWCEDMDLSLATGPKTDY